MLGASLLATVVAVPGSAPASAADPAPSVPGERIQLQGDGLQPLEPARLLDTRDSGSTIDGQAQAGGVVAGGASLTLVVAGRGGVPSVGAGAVVLNVTVTQAQGTGHLTVHPTGSARPNTSNLNFTTGQSVPNLVLAKLGVDGRVELATSTTTHVLADVVGWLPETRDVQTVQPARVLDTRGVGQTVDGQSQATGALRAGETRRLVLAGRAGVPSTGVGAVVLNLTAVGPTAGGYLTVHPSGTIRPNSSTLNFTAGKIVPNLVVAKLGADGAVSIFNIFGSTSVLADVVGWMPSDASYRPLTPARILDTRPIGQTIDNREQAAGPIGAAQTRRLPIVGRGGIPASGVAAVVLNLTGTLPSSVTHLTVYPAGSSVPNASNLNLTRGLTRANLVFAKLSSDGAIDISNAAGTTHVIADVVGYFPTAGTNSTLMDLKAGTILAGPGDVVSATGDATSGASVVLAGGADLPSVGGHLFLSPQDVTPAGLSGQVTDVVTIDTGTRVTLAPANLQDIFNDLKITTKIGQQSVPLSGLAGSSRQSSAQLVGAKCENAAGTSESGTIEAPVFSLESLGGNFDFDLRGGTSRLDLRIVPTATWTTPARAGVSCSFEAPAVTVFAGPVELSLSLKITASSSITGSVTVQAQAPLRLGYDYSAGTAAGLNNGSGLLNVTELSSTGGEMKLGAAAVLSAKIGGILGVQGDSGPSFRAIYDAAGCRELRFGIEIGLAAVAEKWGVGWKFDIARYVLGDQLLSRSGCGGNRWTGTIKTTLTSDIQPAGPGEGNQRYTADDQASYSLPSPQQVAGDGSGIYAADITASGLDTSDAHCYWTDASQRIYDRSWSLQSARRSQAVHLEQGSSGEWLFWPRLIYSGVEAGDSGVAQATYTNFCTESGQASTTSEYRHMLGYQTTAGSTVEPNVLTDTNPDPARLVGTTTWDLTNPPTANMPGFTTYKYTATYDLTLVSS